MYVRIGMRRIRSNLMMMVWLSMTVIGAAMLGLSALGSDIGLDFGSDTSGSTVTAGLGSFLGIGGGAGMIASDVGLGLVPTVVIAGAVGFVSSFVATKIVAWMVTSSSDGNDSSERDAIGQTVILKVGVSAGGMGELWVPVGNPPISTRFYFKSDEEMQPGEEVRITGFNPVNGTVTVEPTIPEDDAVLTARMDDIRRNMLSEEPSKTNTAVPQMGNSGNALSND